MPNVMLSSPHAHAREDPLQILHEVKSKCAEMTQKIDSIINLMQILETYITYSNFMRELEPQNCDDSKSAAHSSSKGPENMNPQDMQKILSSIKSNDNTLSQDEFDTIFETLKQGKSKEEVARMEQMVQMAKSFMK